jgi:hypothetical protein
MSKQTEKIVELQAQLEETARDRETLRALHIQAVDAAIRAEALNKELGEIIKKQQKDYDKLFTINLRNETLLRRFYEFRDVARRLATIGDPDE